MQLSKWAADREDQKFEVDWIRQTWVKISCDVQKADFALESRDLSEQLGLFFLFFLLQDLRLNEWIQGKRNVVRLNALNGRQGNRNVPCPEKTKVVIMSSKGGCCNVSYLEFSFSSTQGAPLKSESWFEQFAYTNLPPQAKPLYTRKPQFGRKVLITCRRMARLGLSGYADWGTDGDCLGSAKAVWLPRTGTPFPVT